MFRCVNMSSLSGLGCPLMALLQLNIDKITGSHSELAWNRPCPPSLVEHQLVLLDIASQTSILERSHRTMSPTPFTQTRCSKIPALTLFSNGRPPPLLQAPRTRLIRGMVVTVTVIFNPCIFAAQVQHYNWFVEHGYVYPVPHCMSFT